MIEIDFADRLSYAHVLQKMGCRTWFIFEGGWFPRYLIHTDPVPSGKGGWGKTDECGPARHKVGFRNVPGRDELRRAVSDRVLVIDRLVNGWIKGTREENDG